MRQLQTHPEYKSELVQLTQTAFHYPHNKRIEDDFAPLYAKDYRQKNYLFFDKDKNELVGHIGAIPRRLRLENQSFEVLLLGGICVQENYRGKGLLKEMMKTILKTGPDSYLFYFLWSDLSQLYEKFGFYEAGEIIQNNAPPIELPPNGFKKVSLSECPKDVLEWIKKSYQKNHTHLITLDRDELDWENILKIKSVDLFYHNEKKLYFMANKGHDLPGIIHEYAPSDSHELKKILSHYKSWLPRSFLTENMNTTLLYMSFIKLGNLDNLKTFFYSLSRDQIRIINIEGEHINFEFQAKEFKLLQKEFLQGVFGPTRIDEFKDFQTSLTIAGVDSV